MKRIFALLMLAPALLLAVTHTVDDDGGADYTTIQDAITACTDGDTVLVYSGTYPGGVDYMGKAISVMSLAITTGDTSYVSQTVIDGQWETGGVRIEGCDGAYLGGFSITRCLGQFNPLWYDFTGAGVFVNESVAMIEFCDIAGNFAETSGGGVGIVDAQCVLSGNKIHDNSSFIGGGFSATESPIPSVDLQIIFSETNRNSIYRNVAPLGSDISIELCDADIYLERFTAPEPDDYFIRMEQCSLNVFESNETVVEPVEADLYVSASGSDENFGVSPEDPLQTVAYAMMKIRADSLHQRTVHVADGYYSHTTTGELLPVHLRRDVNLIGGENTVFDGDGLFPFFSHRETGGDYALFHRSGSISVENFTLINGVTYSAFPLIDMYGLESASVNNVKIENVSPQINEDLAPRLVSVYINDFAHVSEVTTDEYHSGGLMVSAFHHAVVDRVWTRDGVIGTDIGFTHFITPSYCTLRNSLISGNENLEPWPGAIITSGLIINGPYYFVDPDSAVVDIINCTITDNTALDAAVNAEDRVTTNFYNCIISGNTPNEIALDGRYNEGHATFTNCLIENGEDDINAIGSFTYETAFLLTGDPAFLGSGETPYALSATSQCINAGTTDIPGYTFADDAVDLAGNPRIHAGQIDIGCYEYQGVSVDEEPESVESAIAAFPNPVSLGDMRNGELCNIAFSMPQSGEVDVIVYNIRGQRVRLLASGYLGQGEHAMRWDGRDDNGKMVSSGVYLYRMTTEHDEHAGRLTIIK